MSYATLVNGHKSVDKRWRIDPRRWRNDSLAKRPDTLHTKSEQRVRKSRDFPYMES